MNSSVEYDQDSILFESGTFAYQRPSITDKRPFSESVYFSLRLIFEIKEKKIKQKSSEMPIPQLVPTAQEMHLDLLLEAPTPESLIIVGSTKKIFTNSSLNIHEERMLNNFRRYIEKKHLNTLIPQEVYEGNLLALRCLIASDGDCRKAFDKIRSILLWRDRIIYDREEIYKNLNRGFIYSFGRDRGLRPVIYFNTQKIVQAELEMVMRCAHLLLEYLKSEVLIPGKIETWDFLWDLEDINSMSFIKLHYEAIVREMTKFYPCRLNLMIIINTPKIVKLCMKTTYLFSRTESYARMYLSSNYREKLVKVIDRKQLEIKYGGFCPNLIVNYFPPCY